MTLRTGIDGDRIATMIHENFRIEPDDGNKGLDNTMDVCRLAATAALAAYEAHMDERGMGRKAEHVQSDTYFDELGAVLEEFPILPPRVRRRP